MSTWKTFFTLRAAGLFAAAVDERLGYPRDLDPSEYTRGPGRHSATPPHTETHCNILLLADGRYAVEVDEVVEALAVADVEIDVGSGRETVTIDVADAVTLTDDERDSATGRPARGGLVLRDIS